MVTYWRCGVEAGSLGCTPSNEKRRVSPAARVLSPVKAAAPAGDVAAFPKNDGNGHVLVNESEAECVFVAIGRPSATDCHYPDIDMHLFDGQGFRRKDGSEFPVEISLSPLETEEGILVSSAIRDITDRKRNED